MTNATIIITTLLVAACLAYVLIGLRHNKLNVRIFGKMLWALFTVLVASFSLWVVFFEAANSEMYCRVKDNNTLIAAAIAASALAWQVFFSGAVSNTVVQDGAKTGGQSSSRPAASSQD